MIPFGPFRPDVGGPGTGFAQVADSVLPQAMAGGIGYGPFPQLVVPSTATALSGAPRGSCSLIKSDGSYNVYFATASTIEQLSATYTWTTVATGLAVTSGDDMSFLHFGSYLLNSNTSDGFKAYNVETPAGNNAVSGAPSARALFQCNNVVFALDCNGNNRRMQSSGVGDHTAWTTLGADGKTFEDGGALLCGVDLKNGAAVIFQETAMRIVQFGANANALYSINKAADARGSVGERSVVSFDGLVFYLATDGFYRFDLANGNTPIGAEKINKWFLSRISSSDLSTVQGTIDPANKIVCWRWRRTSTTSTTVFEDVLGYDWQLNEWFTATVQTAALARLSTPGYTMDDLDSFGTLDAMIQIPLDDRFFQGGQPVFAALDATYKFGVFSGSPMAATLETCAFNNLVTGLVNWATPIDNAADGTLDLGVSDDLSDALAWKTGVTKVSGGRCGLRGRGMNLGFRRNIPAGSTWTFANGVDHIKSASGGPK